MGHSPTGGQRGSVFRNWSRHRDKCRKSGCIRITLMMWMWSTFVPPNSILTTCDLSPSPAPTPPHAMWLTPSQPPLQAHTSGLCLLNTSCGMGSCDLSSCLLCWLELQDHGLQCFLHHLELPLERLWMLLRSTQGGDPPTPHPPSQGQ